MSVIEAANTLGVDRASVLSTLTEKKLPYQKLSRNQIIFGHETAKGLFEFPFKPSVYVFQIVKGGTGKTSLVYELAVRASLYGASVLCIDMDQQGNLTQAFNQNAEHLPVMIDIVVDHHSLHDSIISVAPGIDLLPSRFENSVLDEVLRQKKYPLERIYREPFQALKEYYDLIIVDCPPSLGQSVAACALSSDYVVSPVTPEKFALSGLQMAYQSIQELQANFRIPIQFGVVLNKFDSRSEIARDILTSLLKDPRYKNKLLKNTIRVSRDFPNMMAQNRSIFETIGPSSAKEDIDLFTRELLRIPDFLQTSAQMIESLSTPVLSIKDSKKNSHLLKIIELIKKIRVFE